MKQQMISSHDYELLCAYADGELKPNDISRLEVRLKKDAVLREGLQQIQMTKSILRQTPTMRAPRNFTLTPEMAGIHRRNSSPFWNFAFRTMQMSAVLSTLLLVFILIGDFLTVGRLETSLLPAAAPIPKQDMALEEKAKPESISSPTAILPPPTMIELAKPLNTMAAPTLAVENIPQAAEKKIPSEMPAPAAAAPPSAVEAIPMEAGAELATSEVTVIETLPVPTEMTIPLPTATSLATLQIEEILPKPTIEPPTSPPPYSSWSWRRLIELVFALIACFSVIFAWFLSKKR